MIFLFLPLCYNMLIHNAQEVYMKFEFTRTELDSIYQKYFTHKQTHMILIQWPSKYKIQLAILQKISTLFMMNHLYAEKEINEILKPIYEDYVMLRRYLIDLKVLKRDAYGKQYEKINDSIVNIIEN